MADETQSRQITMKEMCQQLDELRNHQATQKDQADKLRTDLGEKFSDISEKFSEMETKMLSILKQALKQPDPPQMSSPSASAVLLSTPQATKPPDPPDFRRFEFGSVSKAPMEAEKTSLLPNGMSTRLSKIGFPSFDGTMLSAWLYKCEQFFSLDGTPPESKVRLASLYLEGKALQWHQNYIQNRFDMYPPWSQYVVDVSARFGELINDPLSELVNIKQANNSVEVYLDQFECAMTKMSLPMPHALSIFLTNMNPHLALQARQFKVTTLTEAARIAKLHESALQHTSTKQSRNPFIPYHKPNTQPTYKNPSTSTAILPTPKQPETPRTQPYKPKPLPRKFSYEEMQERRNKGLCMFCDEPYTPGHHLKHRKAQIYVLEADDNVVDEEEYLVEEVYVDETAATLEEKPPTISINALNGSSTFNCMRLVGQYGKRKLYVFVDPGSTHNFIDVKLARDLGCKLEQIKTMIVTAASGDLQTTHKCSNFTWRMQSYTFTTEIRTLPLDFCDLVLGVQWLITLGPILWDFLKLTMEFNLKGVKHMLRGVTRFNNKMVKGGSLNKLLMQEPQIALLQVREINETSPALEPAALFSHISASDTTVENDPSLQSLLHSHANLFAEPQGLPPFRDGFDHKIPLVTGSNPVSLRPYRYSSLQKDVIDKMVQEMLGLMNHIFQDITRKFLLVFFDDILVYSASWEEHLQHLEIVFSILRHQQLYLKLSKCIFGATMIEYLGHFISFEGVSTDPSKVQAIKQWPTPTSQKQLRSFLGLANYYRRFIQGYSIIAKPLSNLLKKDGFTWDDSATDAFQTLKTALSSTPVLALPNFDKRFVVETDASNTGIGAVLMQDNHPICFISRALGPRHQSLSVYEKELTAVVHAVQSWNAYLAHREFTIKTDQRSLKYLLDQKVTTPFQHMWLSKLMGYTFIIEYKQGKENVAADALSRVTGSQLLHITLSQAHQGFYHSLQMLWQTDPHLKKVISDIQGNKNSHPKFSFVNGELRHRGKLVVGNDKEVKLHILKWLHDSAIGGHSGRDKTLHRVKSLFYWPKMSLEVQNYVRNCSVCQKNKNDLAAKPGLLQPLAIPAGIWQSISLDFIEGLPPSTGKHCILVVVDRLSKQAHFIALSHPYTALDVAQAFLDHIYKLHGMPQNIISDRDPTFLSDVWTELFRVNGVDLRFSTAYHPQTDGQTEATNKTLETYLRCMTSDAPSTWSKWLPLAEWWYNTTFHSAIKSTPFEIIYGQPPPLHLPYLPGESSSKVIDRSLQKREELITMLKFHMLRAQNRMKQSTDSHRSSREFKIGDYVYLKLQPYRQHSMKNLKVPHKLSPRFYGPFCVKDRVGKVAYKLSLPPGSAI
ncbi:unnamed protein product, partial [Arabidopsis halleri]